jgi:hypothetical protein
MYDNLERTFIKAEGKNLKKGIIEGGGGQKIGIMSWYL